MLKDIKKTAKHSIVYAIGNMGAKVVGFLLIPFYTNLELLSKSDYGALAVLEATLQVLVGVLAFAMTASLTRWYWDKNYRTLQKSIFFTAFAFLFVVIVPVVTSLSFFSGQFSQVLFNSIDFSLLIKLTLFTAGFQILNNLVLSLLRLKSNSLLYVVVQMLKLCIMLVLVIWGLKYKQQGLMAIWQANLIAESITLLLLLPTIMKNIQFNLQFRILKEMLSYGFPLMLASLSGVLLAVSDRYMLNSMQGLEKTAVYSLGYRISNTIKMLITLSLSLSLAPVLMKKIGQEGSERFYAKVMKYSSFLFSMGLLGLSLFSLEILKVISGSTVYWEANTIIAIITFALLFGQLKDNALIGITIRKKTKITGILVFVTSVLNIVLNFFLIPIWDIYGASLATFLSQFFFFISIYISAQKYYPIPYELVKIFKAILVLVIFVILGLAISDYNIFIRLCIKLTLLIGYPFVLLLFSYYEENEIIVLKKTIRSLRSRKLLIKSLKELL